MIKDWPDCPYCGEPLESEMFYMDLGPRLALFCTCEAFTDIEEELLDDIIASFKEEDDG